MEAGILSLLFITTNQSCFNLLKVSNINYNMMEELIS